MWHKSLSFESLIVHFDEKGVGGFFEDLPVLVFVLAGVSLLVASGVRMSAVKTDVEEEDSIRYVAEMLVQRIAAAFRGSGLDTPTLRSFNETRIATMANETVGTLSYSVAVVVRYPEVEWISSCTSSKGSQMPLRAASDSTFLNAVDETGRSVIIEVIAVVW